MTGLDLAEFLTRARWFGGKGRPLRLTGVRRLGWLTDPGADPAVAIDLLEVTYEDTPAGAPGGVELYQLPLAHYREAQDRLAHAWVGETDDPDAGPRQVYDALHDRSAMAVWLNEFAEAGTVGPLTFRRLAGHDLDTDVHSTLFSGEQSNSTVMYGQDAVMKVFRKVTPGINPDIAIHEALTEGGSDHVAALYGWLEAPADAISSGPAGDGSGGVLQLAMLQEFLRTGADGWDLAQASVRNLFAEADLHAEEVGGDFAAEAARLGSSLSEVHATLRDSFGTGTVDLGSVADLMVARLDAALLVVPGLAEHEDALRGVFTALADLGSREVQRVHGDLHLGQTLRTVKGWKIVDFEGEPAKALEERSRPDVRWRDVAGMLRSFDYAPRAVLMTAAEDPEQLPQLTYRAGEWARRNQAAFLAAYAGQDLAADEQAQLAAYVADKAVYEAVYETRNRPTWVGIPLGALAALARTPIGPSSVAAEEAP